MSDGACIIVIVTDDPAFSAQIAGPMLRRGVQRIRCVQRQGALELVRELVPAMVLVHAQPGCLGPAWDCLHLLQSDEVARTIPTLLYAPPQQALAERAAGQPLGHAPADPLGAGR